jgi:hypothetical protein
MAAEISAGPIYVDDKLYVGNLEFWGPPGDHYLRWEIKSEDARVPKHGYSHPVELRLATPEQA